MFPLTHSSGPEKSMVHLISVCACAESGSPSTTQSRPSTADSCLRLWVRSFPLPSSSSRFHFSGRRVGCIRVRKVKKVGYLNAYYLLDISRASPHLSSKGSSSDIMTLEGVQSGRKWILTDPSAPFSERTRRLGQEELSWKWWWQVLE